ncbi:Protein of uncharacterised function (DUF2508) [Clostridium putrefaciens]|uniref:Protein of uncharacterized function (DUF2508) n=1 Tax=Clostridium putrefaciens TaxID=99675 RepID=A0A381J3F2_9CLOT|nr:DUF2508 family protein [Clostridium putrefaciens]SUY44967.1 Protein of uncharacterised function (DUF2508) [Clostridium putrefaciens]
MKVNKRIYTKEQIEVIQALEETINELETARCMFENANDSKLIEVAIYSEQAIKAKYEYLLFEARKLDIKLDEEIFYLRLKSIC